MTNSDALAVCGVFGVCQLTQLNIVVEGKPIKHYKHFRLHQSATTHHRFTLTLSHDSLGRVQDHHMEDAQKLLGKRILVTFTYKNLLDSPERHFVGVVTNVILSIEPGGFGDIVLEGHSPTILLDGAPHIQSFGGKQPAGLKFIAEKVIKEGLDNQKYKSRVEPNYTGNLSYSCQYDETHYNYLARTAEAYGEQFFYDGTVLHFGKLPLAEKPIQLTDGEDVSQMHTTMKARHVKRSLYGYNSSRHEKLTTGETKISHVSSLAKAAYELSEKTFQTPSLGIAPIKAATHKDIEAAQKSASGSVAVNVFTVSGQTSVPFLHPGCLVDMNMRKAGSAESRYLTKLMITEIDHSVDMLGNYVGSFEAIAADTGYLPTPAFDRPNTGYQIATVTDNKDPLGQGRVQIRFDWQWNGNTTEWIRAASPDAGSSEAVSKNRGFVSTPEIGDQVMVDFIDGHPDRPYVAGSMFHGKIAAGGGEGNNIKSWSSKSGHTLQLDDGAGITVKDKTGGNHIELDGDNAVRFTASQTVALGNGQSSIKLDGDKITIYADSIKIGNVGGPASKIDIKALETLISGKNAIKMHSDSMVEISSKSVIDIQAKTDLKISAEHATVKGKVMTTIKGAVVNIIGAGSAPIQSLGAPAPTKVAASVVKPELASSSTPTAKTGAIQSTLIVNNDKPVVEAASEVRPTDKLYFAAGSNNDSDGWNYVERFRKAFSDAGINGFTRINASSGKADDIAFTSTFRSWGNRGSGLVTENGKVVQKTIRATHPMIEKAFNGILQDQSSLKSGKKCQLNLCGYSYGSVLMAHVAFKLADKGIVINNLILVGSPISSSSGLFSELSNNANIKKVIRHDIPNDKLSNPEDKWEFLAGAKQNSDDSGPHFDLARPGKETDKRIKVLAEKLKKSGIN